MCKTFPKELVRKVLKNIINRYCDEISSYTLQLWIVIDDNADKAKPLGSAVLLTANGKYYLVTAAHVMDGCDISNIAFWDDRDLVQVSGQAVYLSTVAEINKNGDIAVWQLSDEAFNALQKHYSFLPIDRVLMNHQIDLHERYIMVGYPVSKTKKIFQSMTIPIKTLRFVTRGDNTPSKIKSNNLDALINFMVVYHKRKAQSFGAAENQVEHLPDPYGMSGCGLWYLDENRIARLVGIMTGFNFVDTIMIASRIDLAIEIIRKSFDNTIPPSQTISIKWK